VFVSSIWRASDKNAEPLAHIEVATLSLSGVVLQSGAANDDLEKTLRNSRPAPMTKARRGMIPRTVSPAFQVQWLFSKKGRLWLEERLLVPFVFWHPVLSCA
jgi:hypothetical protein